MTVCNFVWLSTVIDQINAKKRLHIQKSDSELSESVFELKIALKLIEIWQFEN